MPGALFFVTGNVLDRKPIFRVEKYAKAFLEVVQEMRLSYDCKIIAFVVMVDHIHLILNPKGGDIQTATGILKSLSAKKIISLSPMDEFSKGKTNQVWQESFKSLPLWSPWMVNQKINYIHANPVKARLCSTAEGYPWSSFRSFYRDEQNPLLQVDNERWWDGDMELLKESVKQWEAEKMSELSKIIEDKRVGRDKC
ncbi:MAG: transposase [Pyrinomonadaceae bacterium]